jgi:hypothetical protein
MPDVDKDSKDQGSVYLDRNDRTKLKAIQFMVRDRELNTRNSAIRFSIDFTYKNLTGQNTDGKKA